MSGVEKWPRVIVYADPVDYVLVGRAIRCVTAPEYVWPADGVACIQYGDKLTFGIIRRKSGITVYGPGHPQSHDATPCASESRRAVPPLGLYALANSIGRAFDNAHQRRSKRDAEWLRAIAIGGGADLIHMGEK